MTQVNINGGSVSGLQKLETIEGGNTHLRGAIEAFGLPRRRVGLVWNGGVHGKPALNADVLSATEAVNAIVDPAFEVLGTNMTSALSVLNVEGGISLTTAGASGDSAILLPHLDANQSPWKQWTWGTDKEVVWEAWIAAGANITAATLYAGLKLTNTNVVATDADQVFFRYQDTVNSGKWQAVDSIGGTDVATDTGETVAVSTQYHLKIVISDARVAKFYVNGKLVRTSAALTNAVDLIPYIGVVAAAVAAKAVVVFGQSISRVAG